MKMISLQNSNIDYNLLATAKEFYNKRGFTYIEVPYMVEQKYSNITAPINKSFGIRVGKRLVGSAEQGFLQLAFHKEIAPYVRFQSITPCFRKDKVDESHSQWFMKLELFYYGLNPIDPIFDLEMEKNYFIESALALFSSLTKNNVSTISTKDGTDIELEGTEIGSYGVRCHENVTWVYGTGIALPRFTYADNSVIGAVDS